MSGESRQLAALDQRLETALAGYGEAIEQARSDDELLALRDALLDWQFASRQLITITEERLGAFEGDDSPRALAAQSELLIEQIEALQDGWESRLDLLLDGGFDEERLPDFFRETLATPAGRERLQEVFAGILADMDQTGEFLDYARRYLLSLVVPPPERANPGGGGPAPHPDERPRPPRR